MTDTKIKFCGLRLEEDVKLAASLDADFMGFILSERFRRYVSPDEVSRLKQFVPSKTKTVGVFVDEPEDYVIACAKQADLDMIQLHGCEADAYIADIKEKTGLPVIKMIKPVSESDIIAARHCVADLILLDSGTGTGKVFDWSLIRDLDRDYILAGGLTPDNVGDAVERLKPFAVDVSSGVETEGIKDFSKMKAFASEVRKI
ncbi:MAG: phosphoribosylanthranilate isomerase [Saccharofermentans sp.]|jgi:phosphoribosylanthranilate isomerase|nr:phosphoribosylanthranilate isomerase [Saccharofermentans sp.]